MPIHRREFMATTAVAAAAFHLGSNRSVFADDTSDIRVACIGVRSRGTDHIRGLSENVVALCDVDGQILTERAAQFKEKYEREVETFVDYRKLLERDDINAISIATPNHTHALITIAGIMAGKDVYVEKPVSHNVWEGRQTVAAARQQNRIVQCGTQSRSSPSLQKAVKFVQDGGLGKVRYAIGTCYKPRPSIGKLKQPLEIPSHINYDLWCGPAEKLDLYRPQLHYDWHWDFNTGNGDMGNQGIHQMDIARWFLGEDELAPRSISIGGRLGYDDAGDTPNTQVVYHDYENAPLIFETRGLPHSKLGQKKWGDSMDFYRGSRVGVIIQCEEGHVVVPSYSEATAFDRSGNQIHHWKGGGDHYKNWLDAVAKQDVSLLNGEIQEGHLSSSLCHVGAVSHQLGAAKPANEIGEMIAGNDLLSQSFDRMASHLRANDVDIDSGEGAITAGPWLEVDPSSERFTNNEQANAKLTREYRASFQVPKIEATA